MSVDYHFADVLSKATWERILAALETPAAPEAPPPEGLNISSQPGQAPVRLQPDATNAEQCANRLWKVRGMLEHCIEQWNSHWTPGDV